MIYVRKLYKVLKIGRFLESVPSRGRLTDIKPRRRGGEESQNRRIIKYQAGRGLKDHLVQPCLAKTRSKHRGAAPRAGLELFDPARGWDALRPRSPRCAKAETKQQHLQSAPAGRVTWDAAARGKNPKQTKKQTRNRNTPPPPSLKPNPTYTTPDERRVAAQ